MSHFIFYPCGALLIHTCFPRDQHAFSWELLLIYAFHLPPGNLRFFLCPKHISFETELVFLWLIGIFMWLVGVFSGLVGILVTYYWYTFFSLVSGQTSRCFPLACNCFIAQWSSFPVNTGNRCSYVISRCIPGASRRFLYRYTFFSSWQIHGVFLWHIAVFLRNGANFSVASGCFPVISRCFPRTSGNFLVQIQLTYIFV